MRPQLRGITATTLHESRRFGAMRASPLLRELGRADVDALLGNARWARFARGDTLTLRGSRPGSCWLLLTGYVKEHRALETGAVAITGFRGPGDLVAEVAAITRKACEHDVTALSPGEALVLEVDALRHAVQVQGGLHHGLLVAVAARATGAEATLARNDLSDTRYRIVQALVELADRWGVQTPRGVNICVPLTQTELAEWVGASRETAAKVLQRLRAEGLVETSRRRLVVLDIEHLRERALGDDVPWLSTA